MSVKSTWGGGQFEKKPPPSPPPYNPNALPLGTYETKMATGTSKLDPADLTKKTDCEQSIIILTLF